MGWLRNGRNSTVGNRKYPDVSEVLRQKAQRRRRLARLSFEEKIAVVNKWRKLTRSIRKSELAQRNSRAHGMNNRRREV